MKRREFLRLMAAAAGGTLLPTAAAQAQNRSETSRNIRLPNKPPAYIEDPPEADYRHASESAYEAFRDMKYAVRIHWGIYSVDGLAGESWPFLSLSNEDRDRYNHLYQTWNPQRFDADAWMRFFAESGFRGLAFTAKHHEGFSMFDTRTRVRSRANWIAPGGPALEACDLAYSIAETPYRHDMVGEVCEAAHRYGLKIDLYFSHPDWYDADFRPYGYTPIQVAGSEWLEGEIKRSHGRPAALFPPPTPAEQRRMMLRHRQQLRELLSNYGNIDMVCLDISLGREVWPELRETIKQLRALQPDVMFRDRGIGNYGDYFTPERFVPNAKESTGMPWMTIYPLGSSFSYRAIGENYKGAKWIVDNLVDCAAKGGNFMVGIGPDRDGEFDPRAVAQVREAGQWIRANGDAIFGTRERPGELWHEGESVRFTRSKDGRVVYAISLARPAGTLALKTVQPKTDSPITLVSGSDPLTWRRTPDGVEISFPAQTPPAPAYAFRIEV
jgi:alpha-L-fucosidase